MPSYILLARFTQQGVERNEDGPARIEAARKILENLGGRLQSIYLTMGRYDSVAIIDAPDDEAATKFSIAVSAQGNVKIESLRAFDETEYAKIVSSLP